MTKKKSFLDVLSTSTFLHILFSIFLGFLVGALFPWRPHVSAGSRCA